MIDETENFTITPPESVIAYYSRNNTIGKLDMFTLIYNKSDNKFYKISAKNSDTVVIEAFDEIRKHNVYFITLYRDEPVSFVNGYYVINY